MLLSSMFGTALSEHCASVPSSAPARTSRQPRPQRAIEGAGSQTGARKNGRAVLHDMDLARGMLKAEEAARHGRDRVVVVVDTREVGDLRGQVSERAQTVMIKQDPAITQGDKHETRRKRRIAQASRGHDSDATHSRAPDGDTLRKKVGAPHRFVEEVRERGRADARGAVCYALDLDVRREVQSHHERVELGDGAA
jgi:hypothetical protein